MKRINLIPEEAKKVTPAKWLKIHLLRSRTTQIVTLFIIGFVIVNIWQATAIVRYKVVVMRNRHAVQKLSAKLIETQNDYAAISSEKTEILRQTKNLDKKITLLESIKSERTPWAKFLAEMSRVTMKDLWINKLSMNRDKVTIVGTTLNNAIVSQFMADLDESRYFRDTSFNYTQKAAIAENAVMDFEVTTHIVLE